MRGMRIDHWLWAGSTLLAGPLLVTAPAPTLSVVLLVTALYWRRLRLPWLCVTAVLLSVSGWRAQSEITQYRAAHDQVRAHIGAPQRCFIRARVRTSPTRRGDSLGFKALLIHAECERGSLPADLTVRLYGGPAELARGDVVEGVAQLGIVRLFRNFELPDPYVHRAHDGTTLSGGLLSARVVLPGIGLGSWVDHARAHVRARIEATFAPDAVGMAKALVLGENDLTEAEDSAFKSSGLAHLLAVSGTHLIFAVLSLVAGLQFILCRIPPLAARGDVGRVAAFVGAVLSIAYADFAGGSGSAWRAAWMLAASLTMRVLWREVRVTRAVAISMLVGWGANGLVVFDYSFMLSLAATFGLLTLGRRWAVWVESRALPRPVRLLALGTVATVSSMLPCAPLLACLSSNLSVLGVIANVFAAPFGETIALPLCLSHALLSPVPWLERGTAWVASGALLVVRGVALKTAELSAFGVVLPLPTPWQLALLAASAAAGNVVKHAAWGHVKLRRCLLATSLLGLIALECAARAQGRPQGVLRVTVLDVGQGDAALVDLPDGSLMLVDGGGFVGSPVDPGQRVILPVLRARRRSYLDVVVLSHPHPDHFGGLVTVLETTSVGELWDTAQGEVEGAGPDYARLLQAARRGDVRVTRPAELCERTAVGGAGLHVLAPCPRFTPGRGANDNSLVLRLEHGRRAALFAGDAEVLQERELAALPAEHLRSDLLKVAHHGSRTSSDGLLLQRIQPQFSVISCGMRNRYGHPHSAALQRLGDAKTTVLRTDLLGAVSWSTDGERLGVSSASMPVGVVTRRPPWHESP